MMEELSIKEVISVVKGQVSASFFSAKFRGANIEELKVKGVSIDSRTVKEGDLFVAIKGQKNDGHSYVESVLQNGAVAVIVDKNSKVCKHKFNSCNRSRVIEVKDTVKALGDLALYYREKFTVSVIGITGSNGKTTTKELTARCLASGEDTACHAPAVLKTKRSLNSLIGLPLTLFNLSKKHKYCVLEIGANQPGEIARLAQIAKPEIGVITNIGPVHLQGFGSMGKILEEKSNLLDNVKIGILNGDDILLQKYQISNIKNQKYKNCTFGIYNKCDLKAERIKRIENIRYSFYIRNTAFFLPLFGFYQIYNALAAISVGLQCGIELKELADTLRNAEPLQNRDKILFTHNDRNVCVIDSSYNANPVSMKLAIEELKNIKGKTGLPGTGSPGRKIAVLGDMLELGEKEYEFHLEIGKFLNAKGIDVVIGVGNLAKNYVPRSTKAQRRKDTGDKRYYFEEVEKAGIFLKDFIRKGDVLLIKGSRAIGLEKIIEMLNV